MRRDPALFFFVIRRASILSHSVAWMGGVGDPTSTRRRAGSHARCMELRRFTCRILHSPARARGALYTLHKRPPSAARDCQVLDVG